MVYKKEGGWTPAYVFELKKGEVAHIPPAFVHESLNVENETCASSLTFQFNTPAPAVYWRTFYPRLRRLGDFWECMDRIKALATFQGKVGKVASLLKMFPKDPAPEDEIKKALELAVGEAWKKVLKAFDKNEDSLLVASEVKVEQGE